MKPSLAHFLCFLLSLNSFCEIQAQNLIPDPGFEIWDGSIGQVPNTLGGLTYWYNANGTADHHHQQNPPGSNLTSLSPCPTGNGNTDCGFPYEGEAVLGCWKGNGADGTKEWGGIQLSEPMVPGGCYEVSFWIQNKKDNPDFFMSTSNWGIFFSETQYPSFNPNLINYDTKADQFVTTEVEVNESEWRYFEFSYTANEAYEYAYVGYVGNASNATSTTWSNDFLIGFYAWFDDIRVVRIDPYLELTNHQVICKGDSVLVQSESNFPILWTDGIQTDSSNSFWVFPQENVIYYFETQDSTACSILDSVVIEVLEKETILFSEIVYENSPPFLIDNSAANGNWEGIGIINSKTGLFDPSISGNGEFEINFISDGNCSENFRVILTVLPKIESKFYIPNVFSPNGDGINDEFEVFPNTELSSFSLHIYNRWGSLVFESSNQKDGWDGRYPSGEKANQGIYTYILEYTLPIPGSKKEFLTGDVLILK